MNEITEQEIIAEMEKPVMVALNGLNWFLILSLLDQVLKMDNVFATEQDRESVRNTVKFIHNQVFNKEDKSLIDLLSIKPKKLIVKKDLVL